MKDILHFCLIVILSVSSLFGQSTSQYWNTTNGLSNNWISDITQDKMGYIWIATQYGLNRFDGYNFKSFQYQPNDLHSLSSNWILSIKQNNSKFLWINAYLRGLNRFHVGTGKTQQNWSDENGNPIKVVRSIYTDDKQTVWIGTPKGLLRKTAKQTFFEIIHDQMVYDIKEGKEGNLLLLHDKGIYQFHKQKETFQQISQGEFPNIGSIYVDKKGVIWWLKGATLQGYVPTNGTWKKTTIPINNTRVRGMFAKSSIFEDTQQRLWIGGEKGITIVASDREHSQTIDYNSVFPKGVSEGKALCFYEDYHHNIWIGTTKGLILQSPFTQRFAALKQFPNLQPFQSVRGILQIKKDLWLATEEGLFKFDLKNPTAAPQKILSEYVFVLLKGDENTLYAGGENLHRVDLRTLQTQLIPRSENGFQGGRIWSLVEDKQGKIWIGSLNMLSCYDPKQNRFEYFSKKQIPTLKSTPSQTLLVDAKGRLWAGSLHSGLYLFEDTEALLKNKNNPFQRFYYDENQPKSLSNNLVMALAEGKDGAIWVGTDGGLNRIDPVHLTVKRFLKKDGLIDEKIMGLLVDDAGKIWGSTIGHGIFQLDPETEEFTFFNQNDGLFSNNFLVSSYYKNQAGNLFFGSDNGVQTIDPKAIDNFQKPRIRFHFTTLYLPDSIINLSNKKTIKLPHHYQSFRVQYSTINFFQAPKTSYYYQLEGVHSDWQSNGNNREILFTSLGSGDYTLKVKAVNPDLILEETIQTLSIKILPPWWRTFWAYLFYSIVFVGAIAFIYRLQLKRQLEKAEAQRLQELDVMKTRFFTNITHEFRTPLTVILGLAGRLRKNNKKEVASKGQLIWRNGQQVLELINQILAASKLKAGKLPVEYVYGDLLLFLKYLVESFHSLAATKNIRLHFLPEVTTLYMDYDTDKIKQITSNLLSNAIRFTPEGGDIYLQVKSNDRQVALIFRDTGKGIKQEHLPYIFERFYQVEHSQGNTGIGLSFTKELIILLGGTISVKSEKGSTFTVRLPIQRKAEKPAQMPLTQKTKVEIHTNNHLNTMHSEEVPLLLLVEDNDDVLYYLIDCLKMNYRVETARDGEAGIQKAQKLIPDLIISDVMMPKKDGYEVCKTLKQTEKTSHIPIILLTAKVEQTAKIEGLEMGADAYLYKPFEKKELLIRIQKLLEIRKQLQKHFQRLALGQQGSSKGNNKEDAFVEKVSKLVQQHLDNPHFGIPQLCQKLGISRVHLHRKLKALTNQSTSHFIRTIRLQKAKSLLQTTDLNVSEVAYEVGFADPAYFSKVYSEVFGESPSVTRK